MPAQSRYTREQLGAAVAAAHSWRGVLRNLGLRGTSAGSQRAVRRQVEAYGIDCSHFTGQRRWTDQQLADAIAQAHDWNEVLNQLGLAVTGGGARTQLRAHALRLGLSIGHLAGPGDPRPSTSPFAAPPQAHLLRTCAANLAAAWFLVRGHDVLWPLEPCRYDFVVRTGDTFHRIQVKTTITRSGMTSVVTLVNSRRRGHVVYSPEEIDFFFVLDMDLDAYLIPLVDVAGYTRIHLRRYRHYRVAERGQWLQDPAS